MMRQDVHGPGLGDALRELCAAASYPATGYWLRSRRWGADPVEDLHGKVCVVTGASRGLGLAAARSLGRRGATVVMVCRDRGRGEAARRAVAEAGAGDRALLELADVASVGDVRAAGERIAARFSRIDVLINNAGILLPERERTAEGHEKTFATNVLGGFLLTRLLLPRLLAAAPARIIHVGSAAMYFQRLDTDVLTSPAGAYVGELAYARSKRALAELSALWAERLEGTGVTSNLMHPGLTSTPGVERTFPLYHRLLGPLLRDPDQGADTMVWLASAPAVAAETGKLWFDREARPAHFVPWTQSPRAEAIRLWDTCAEACGVGAELGGDA